VAEAGSVATGPRTATQADIKRLTELCTIEDERELTPAEQGEKDALVSIVYSN